MFIRGQNNVVALVNQHPPYLEFAGGGWCDCCIKFVIKFVIAVLSVAFLRLCFFSFSI